EVLGVVGDGDLSANQIQVRVAHLGLDRTTNTPVVILQEQEGERVLPIWIGPAEASAIAMELAGVKFARPLTHDLLKQVILGLGADLRKVIITQVKDNTYYAELHIYRGDAVIQIDARPSDSIAVALRLKAPIFTSENLLGLTSVETGEGGLGGAGTGRLRPRAAWRSRRAAARGRLGRDAPGLDGRRGQAGGLDAHRRPRRIHSRGPAVRQHGDLRGVELVRGHRLLLRAGRGYAPALRAAPHLRLRHELDRSGCRAVAPAGHDCRAQEGRHTGRARAARARESGCEDAHRT